MTITGIAHFYGIVDSRKDDTEKSQYQDTICSKAEDMVTDLQKCCMTM